MQALRFAFITQPRLCINSGFGGRVNFCGSVSQRRGGCQAVASLRGLRPPGPSGSSILLAWQMGTFMPERGPKVFWLAILSSTAAGLRIPFYLAFTSGCKEKVYLRLGTGFASGVYLGLFPVLSGQLPLPSQTGAPRAGRLFPSVTNSPGCRAPMGLACSIFCLSTKYPSLWKNLPLLHRWLFSIISRIPIYSDINTLKMLSISL